MRTKTPTAFNKKPLFHTFYESQHSLGRLKASLIARVNCFLTKGAQVGSPVYTSKPCQKVRRVVLGREVQVPPSRLWPSAVLNKVSVLGFRLGKQTAGLELSCVLQ